jgi:hypothetical protein
MKHYHTKLIPPFALAYAENMYTFFPHLQGFLPTFSLFEVWELNIHGGNHIPKDFAQANK